MSKATGTVGIDEWYSSRPEQEKSRRKAGWMSFLAVADEVFPAIEAGYTLKIIHEYLADQGMLKCNYDTFRGYVKKYNQNSSAVKKAQVSTKKVMHKPQVSTGFTFDPKPDTDKIY
ncbi:TraK family protein [Shewanella frigidimarina]|uniref:TraK family protein n=1 Tax=Shewanella frigidimarina TaxID=56812 RepID=UPI003D7967C6